MSLLQDISNTERSASAPSVLKTFERRKKVQQQEDPPPTPLCQACSTSATGNAPDSSTSSASSLTHQHDAHTRHTDCSTFPHRGRRSSILHAAAVPGHEQCREVPASRSLLLQKMSKARLKAYLAYTKQMAEYFAEVDQFQLIEEVLEAGTAQKIMPQENTKGAALSPMSEYHSPANRAAVRDGVCYESDLACQTPLSAYSPDKRTASNQHICSQQQQQKHQDQFSAVHEAGDSADCNARCSDRSSRQPQCNSLLHKPLTPERLGSPDDKLLATTPPSATSNAEHSDTQYEHGVLAADRQRQEEQLVPSTSHHRDAQVHYDLSEELTCDVSSRQLPRSSAATAADTAFLQHNLYATSPATAEKSQVQGMNTVGTDTASLIKEIEQLTIQEKGLLRSPSLAVMPEQVQQQVQLAIHPQACGGQEQAQQQDEGLQQEQSQQAIATARRQQSTADLQQAEQQLQQQSPRLDNQMQQVGQQQQPSYESNQLEQMNEQQLQQLLQELSADAAAQKLAALELAAVTPMALTPLQRMLQACVQQVDMDTIPCMKEFMSDVTDMKEIIKLGEGTYGEAFKSPSSGIVFKLVPMEGDNLINGYEQKKASDLLAEAIIASTLSALTEECDLSGQLYPSCTTAFVKTHKVGVCRGPYPQPFVKAWKAWDKRNTSENDPISQHPRDQLYAVFAMADCGKDLESYQLKDFNQARSMMFQVALALAIAEDCLAFEHRDLHWGNVMLAPAPSTYIHCRLRGCSLKVRTEGSVVSLIDFTASRLQTPAGDVAFCDLEGEEGLFDGPKGKPQFETYRRMRKVTKGDWAGSHPKTNVMWMLYLAELLLSSDKPIAGATAAQKRQLREFKKRVANYSCCGEVIWDELFKGLWAVVDS